MDINEKRHSQTKQNYYKKKTQGKQYGEHRIKSGEEDEVFKQLHADRRSRFNGTDQYWKHLFGLKYTDGVKAHAEIAQAYWVLDTIASWQIQVKENHDKHGGWMVWKLDVQNGGAVLTARADDDSDPFVKQEIEFTDHPAGVWEFWQEGDVVLIPEEH